MASPVNSYDSMAKKSPIPVKITLRQAAELIEGATAVVFDHMALAWINIDWSAINGDDPDALWIEYTHEDDEGLCFEFNISAKPQDITLCGSDIELRDVNGELTTITLYTRWEPETPEGALPRRSVGVLLSKPDGSGLWLSERLPKQPATRFDGCIATPGGKVDPGETLEAALRRETLEETGVALDSLACVEDGIYDGSYGRYQAFHFFAVTTEEPRNLEPEKHGPWRYYRTEELTNLKLMESTRNAISVAINLGFLKVVENGNPA